MSARIQDFEKLSPAKQKLLLARLRKREEAEQRTGEIPRSPRRETGEPFPLSFPQQRLWFLDRMEPGSPAYNLANALLLEGRLDVPALERTLGALVERHESLRTVFETVNGTPVQRVLPGEGGFALPVVDLAALEPCRAKQEARRLAAAEAARPYDVPRGPHLRALLLFLPSPPGPLSHPHSHPPGEGEPSRWLALLGLHHIVSDGWSMGVLVRELGAFYRSFVTGAPAGLPALPIQYPDFADWQRRTLQGEVLEEHLRWWREQLAGAPSSFDLPADRPRPPVQGHRGTDIRDLLPAAVAGAAGSLALQRGATPFMVLLAALALHLARHAGQEDISVGSPVANRNRLETEGLIGFFVNTLVLRVDAAERPERTFLDLLDQVRRTTLGAYAHQDLPFERIVEELKPERDLSRSPLYQVLFALQNAPAGTLELPGLALAPVELAAATAVADLSLEAMETPAGLAMSWRYDVDLFDGPTVQRLAERFADLLAAAVAGPDLPLAELPWLPEAERFQVLMEWSRSEEAPPEDASLADLFARQAEAIPDAPALEDAAGDRLTYRELADRTRRLARHLRRLGVGPEVPVGISLERSADRVIAALAVIEAGGAYVPLDPTHPKERLALLLEDTGAPVVIGKDSKDDKDDKDIKDNQKTDSAASLESLSSLQSLAGGGSLAYLMYTSGSTGRPKGVAVVHRGIARLARWARSVGVGPGDTVLQLAPFAFDASTLEIWGALLNGARVVVPPPGVLSLEEIGDLIERHRVTVLWLTAGLFHQMVDGALERLAPLRLLLAGGDVLSVPHVRRVLEALPGVRLVNGYGPTENTTFTCCHPMEPLDGPRLALSVPLGRPIHGTRVVVVDRSGRAAPVGVPGELCTGGAGLARGYLGRPDLTAAAFVPDPWAEEPGERLYRTGDLARFLPDGLLELLGRIDQQVKIRGFRVEPGEIETLLATHPDVQDAAVVVGQDAAGKRLIACVTLNPKSEIQNPKSDLRAWLGERLPEPMVPAAFLVLDALPLTPNGKVDRQALARLAPEPTGSDVWEAPRTPAEEVLAGLWAGLLGVDRVGVHDDFFDLGGHSLLATQLVSRVREAFGVEIPLRTLFEAPVLADLAGRIEAAGGSPPPAALPLLPPIVPVGRDAGPLPLSFAQERLWFLDELDPGTPTLNMPFSAWLRQPIDEVLLARALNEVVRRHEVLRTTFGSTGGQPWQRIAPALDLPLPAIDLRGLDPAAREREATRLAAEEGHLPFDLARGPLLRARVVRLGAAERLLLITVHHIVADGWSLGLLMRELHVLYGAFAAARPSPLPELPVQYADYASWQRRWLGGAALEAQIGTWRGRLGDPLPVLDLPTDRPRPAVQTYRGGALTHQLDPDLTGRLAALGRREGATLFMVLLAGFQALLGRLAGQDDVVVGTPVAGRGRAETEDLIGCFLNNLALRTDLAGDPSFRELLGRARATALEAYEHQDVPFERLLEELRVPRDLSRTPLFQVFLNMLSFPTQEGELGGTDEGLRPEVRSKFDLTIYAVPPGSPAAGLRLDLVYNADLFDGARVAGMMAQLEGLLAQAVEDPERRIGDLSLVTAAARSVLPDPSLPLAGVWQGSVSRALAESAARQPGQVAVDDGEETWTWAELDEGSGRLARWLRAEGVRTGDVAAVWAHRGAGLPRAVLGALRAGAAVMILDPEYPASRLVDYLRTGRPRAWLGVPGAPAPPPEVVAALDELGCACRLDLTRSPGAVEGAHTPEIGPDDAAVLTFTSGSTGRPKGVVGRHGPLTAFYPWMGTRFGITAADRFGMLSALSHDPLQRDLFTPVWFGATLCIPDPERIGSPGYLGAWVRRERITVLHLTPAMLELLAGAAEEAPEGYREMPSLRLAFVVGDLLKRSEVARLQRLAPALTCVNLYGSTETQRSVACYVVPRPEETGAARIREAIPLGHGMEGVQALILARSGRLAGIGELGEIHLRSGQLARGYLDDPALTAERFLPDPFSPSPGGRGGDGRGGQGVRSSGGRVYRTGDLGRYLPDGNAEFAGRADVQVKIRGFRIEPGEIEAVLARFPGVQRCAVVARDEPGGGDRRLVAYVVPEAGAEPAPALLRAFLGERLPAYMVPADWVMLAALPLTRTGKLDPRALPAPERPAVAGRAPRTDLERELAAIWSELLGREAPGIEDDFFDLGGHSLLATRLLSRIRDRVGVELPLRAVFERPTIAGLAALIAEDRGEVKLPPLVRRPPGEDPPLSFGQERLWFLHQLDPRSPAYNLPHALRLTGPLDPAALAHAFAELARRHEILRTRYAAVEGVPVQVVDPAELLAPLPLIDLSALPPEARESEAAACIRRDARAPFDLAADHPLRARLLCLGPADHALSLTVHHIASDGWSGGLLIREAAELYRAFAAGRPAALPDLPVQYADFAVWQRRAFASGALDPQRAWWRERLGDPPPPLDLPTDRPRPAAPTWAGAGRGLELPAELAAAVDALGRRQGATLFMTLLAAFATLLSRISGQDDLTIGTPVAGRSRTEVEGLIGFFVNTLVIRVELAGDPSFAELLGRVRATALGAFVHQDVPFEELVEELQPERDLSHPPLFQVLFVLQNTPAASLEVAGLTFQPLPADSGAATFDLTLSCAGDARGIGGLLQYRTELFDAPTLDRLLGHYRNLLAAAAAHPERRLGDLPILSPAERHQLVEEHNDTAVLRPDDLCLHELFERQVERAPDAVAVVVAATGEEITYRDLDARADRLAAWLRARGVGPEVSVGVALERSPELVVSFLAILKAGGVWVPLDPAYPPERLAYLIEDAAVSVLLDQESWPVDLPDIPVRPTRDVMPDHLAYRIYTSGSTGRPKAVLVPHRAIVHHMRWIQEDWPLGPSDSVLQVLSVSFDASFVDLWGPLLAGARLVLPHPASTRDAARTADEIVRFGVTRYGNVPPWIAELTERPELAGATALRRLFMGGQELPADLARRLHARGWQAVNFYGPTEATVTATAWSAAPGPEDRTVPIGRPIHNYQIHLLGPAAEPLPLGVPGELCIGGAGVARGYAGRPDLTADRFHPDPFGGPGARLYRTGDRARRRADGVLEFLGRVDRQVKVRGYRIEPGEVEAVLAGHPALRDVAVAARKARGEVRLIAYGVPRELIAVEDLRTWLQERLPEPMIPTGWVLLDALPRTPNGKVDLAALPEPETVRVAGEHVPPRDDLELGLAAIWEDLLDVRPVGIQDDFFTLGGHSLLVLRLLARIERELGTKLPPAVLFTAPTIEKLATVLRDGRLAGAGPLVVLSPRGHRPPIIWAHAAAGTVTAYADIARRLPDRPVWALQAPEVLPATLEELAAVHIAALRAAQPEGPYHLAGWSFGGIVAFEIARQLQKAGAEVAPIVLVDTRAPGAIEIPDDLPSLLAAFAADQGLPPDVDARDIETLRPLFETFRKLLGMLRTYHPEPYPGPITLFRAEQRAAPAPADLGWTPLAGGGLEIRPLPGDHAGVIRGAGAERLAEELKR